MTHEHVWELVEWSSTREQGSWPDKMWVEIYRCRCGEIGYPVR